VVDALRGGAGRVGGIYVQPEDANEEAVALLVLRELPDVGFVTLERLLRTFGSGRSALGAEEGRFRGVAGVRAADARSDPGRREGVREVVGRATSRGIRVLPRGTAEYPERLLHLAQPPAVLFLRGDATLLRRRVVAVVGSRRSTAYGRRVAADVARVLVARGIVVASGLALGVDGAVHRATLEAGGSTLAVLGSGADVPHPPSNRGLFQEIGCSGLLLTEFPPGTPPFPHHFPRRNRILAALAQGVLVVEAARRSGALITSDLALELGRAVMAVPGPVFSARSEGTNRMIRDGAAILTEPPDVLSLLDQPTEATIRPSESPALGPDAVRLWSRLADGGLGVDDLARETGIDTPRVLSALAGLELSGWIERAPGMRFVRRGTGSRPLGSPVGRSCG
jgi:DNA processing protein